jgi:hypothetical protein
MGYVEGQSDPRASLTQKRSDLRPDARQSPVLLPTVWTLPGWPVLRILRLAQGLDPFLAAQ